MLNDHFECGRERRARRANFRTPSLSELSGLIASIFLPAFRGLGDFFRAMRFSLSSLATVRCVQ